jgi:hypothetical protein
MLRPIIRSTRGGTSPRTDRLGAGIGGLALVTIACVVLGGADTLLFMPML